MLNASDKQQKIEAKEKKKRIYQSNHEFVAGLNNAIITIPDEVIDYNLEKAGCNCSDLRVKRLIGIAAKKMIHDVIRGADAHREHYIQGLNASKRKTFKNKVNYIYINARTMMC